MAEMVEKGAAGGGEVKKSRVRGGSSVVRVFVRVRTHIRKRTYTHTYQHDSRLVGPQVIFGLWQPYGGFFAHC